MDIGKRIETSLTKLESKQRSNGAWAVAYDGAILGDDRGFPTQELADQEIRKRLAKDARDAVTYDRPLLYTA